MKTKRQSYIKGAAIISLGGFVSKLIGAAYRIPLVKYLGGRGMGIYQMVYPLYCMLLTVSASGIPTGISRLISSGGADGAERRAFFVYGGIGVAGTLIMFAAAGPLAALQGEAGVFNCCRLLSPSVFLVAIISIVRGYFQGKGDMYPTAFTEILEQSVKVAAGVIMTARFAGDMERATAAAVSAVTLSEGAACIACIILYALSRPERKPLYKLSPPPIKRILYYTVPLTLTAMALPLSQLAEGIVAVNLLKGKGAAATELFGVFSGCAVTMVNLPVSITYGLAAAGVPGISPLAAKGRVKEAKRSAYVAMAYTLIVAVPCAICLFAFAPLAAKIIFPSLKEGERALLIKLIKIMSINAVTSSLVQTASACVTALGRPLYTTVTQWTSAILRVALTAALIYFTPLSIAGAAISANCAYFVAAALNICYIISIKSVEGHTDVGNVDRFGSKGRRFNPVG